MNDKNQILAEHFERLKELIPEVYSQEVMKTEDGDETKLFQLLKRSLGIVEAIYLQGGSPFNPATVEEYARVVKEVKSMGYDYSGNEGLLEKATGQLIMKAKKPMEKAKGKKKESGSDRKAM
ncbi:hypothetical protein [Marinoscillum sp.]|uniref:hypothetical protein n=1 Tax=Marinoscillum sp. TaxID=2024838 RepID=UPI003BA8DC7E